MIVGGGWQGRASLALVAGCFAVALAACGGGGGGGGNLPPVLAQPPTLSAPSVMTVELPPPNPSDGEDYKTPEFDGNYGLGRIRADVAYQRGYFGQSVTVAIIDSGIAQHADLDANVVPGYDFIQDEAAAGDADKGGHGTGVAGVVAARRNHPNDPDEPGMHGVAPLAKLMPLKLSAVGPRDSRAAGGDSQDLLAFEFAMSHNVPILNNSFGSRGSFQFSDGVNSPLILEETPLAWELLTDPQKRSYQNYYSRLSIILAGKESALVWAAGNGGWNAETGEIADARYFCGAAPGPMRQDCDPESYFSLSRELWNSLANAAANGIAVKGCKTKDGEIKDGEESLICDNDIRLAAPLSLNQTSIEGLAPLFENSLLGKWVVVVATDENDVIASFSDGCGRAMHWCLAAPGKGVFAPTTEGRYKVSSGTSFAAPHVSGALAVLRSRFPDMPMRAILAILFKTAKEKGADGIDPVYGHGLLDLGAAITVQGRMELAIPASSGGGGSGGSGGSSGSGGMASVPLSGMSGARLSPGFSRLHRELSGLSLAVSYLGGAYYYDAPLSSLLEVERRRASLSGMAAADMLMSERRAELGGAFRAVLDGRTGGLSRVSYGGDAWRLAWRLGDDAAPLSWMEEEAVLGWTPFMEVGRSALASWELLGGWTAFSAIGAGAGGYRQHGLRWRSGELSSGWGFWAEGSRLTEEGGFLGNRGDALGVSGSRTDWGRWGFFGEFGGWRWRGEHGYGRTAATVGEVGLIESATGLGYSVWRLEGGMSDALLSGDELRLGVEGSPRARGRIRLRFARSSGEVFVEEFQYALPMRAELETRELGELGESGVTWRMGYKWSPGRGALAALGLEYATGGDMSEGGAASFRLRWVF